MPRNTDLAVAASAVLLTDANVTALRVHNRGTGAVRLMATVGAVAPGAWAGAVDLHPGQTLSADLTLAELFPGVPGANRVYAIAEGFATILSVSHA